MAGSNEDDSRQNGADNLAPGSSAHTQSKTSDEIRLTRRRRLVTRLYGWDYVANPLAHSYARRRSIGGDGSPSLAELLTGADFRTEDYGHDLSRFCWIILRYEKVLRCHFLGKFGERDEATSGASELAEVFGEVKLAYVGNSHDSARRVCDALEKLKLAVNRKLYDAAFGFPEFEHRLQFYLACAHDQPAQARIAQLCLDAATDGSAKGAEIRALKCSFAWLSRSQQQVVHHSGRDGEFLSGPQIFVEGGAMLRAIGDTVQFSELAFALGVSRGDVEIPFKGSGTSIKKEPTKLVFKGNDRRKEDEEFTGPGLVVFTNAINDRSTTLSSANYNVMVGKKIRLVQPPDLVPVRRLLLNEFPHARELIETLLREVVAHCDTSGRPIIRIRPTILLGDPGCAKSAFAKTFGEVMGLPCLFFPCAGVIDSMFGASSKKWSEHGPALPVEKIFVEKVANVLVVLDEIEKTGSRRENGRLQDVILAMVEPSTAASYFDQSLSAHADLSSVNWLCTANSLTGLSAPLRDRFRVLRFPSPSREHLPVLLPSILRSIGRARYGDERWVAPLDGVEIQQIENVWKGGSIRILQRLVETVLDTRDKFQPKM